MGILTTTLTNAQAAQLAARRAHLTAQEVLALAEKRLKRAEQSRSTKTAARQAEYDAVAAELGAAAAAMLQADAAAKAAERALRAVRDARWAERLDAIRVTANLGDDMLLRGQAPTWTRYAGGSLTLCLVTRDGGREVARFGFDVDIYAPSLGQRFNAETRALEPEWEAAAVNWGSVGSMNVATARDMLRLHARAIAIAETFNICAEAWYAQDSDD